MSVCYLCGQDYREVWKDGRLVKMTGDQPHSKVCSAKRFQKRPPQTIKTRARRKRKAMPPTPGERINREADARLRVVLER